MPVFLLLLTPQGRHSTIYVVMMVPVVITQEGMVVIVVVAMEAMLVAMVIMEEKMVVKVIVTESVTITFTTMTLLRSLLPP